jgi:hypothetical protein
MNYTGECGVYCFSEHRRKCLFLRSSEESASQSGLDFVCVRTKGPHTRITQLTPLAFLHIEFQ